MDAERPHGANRRVGIAIGRPTQNVWMINPTSIIWTEKGCFLVAESGTTMRSMKK